MVATSWPRSARHAEAMVVNEENRAEETSAPETPDHEASTEAVSEREEPPGGDERAAPEGEDPVTRLQTERDALHQKLLRVAADFDNFRKRTRKELEEAERRGREAVLREVLPIIDNLERAVQSASGAQSAEAVAKGVQMVLRLFEETASRLGLQRVGAVGERFDPNVHDAVQQQETDEHPPGTVIGELIPGYKLGERLLRAAMVVVARPRSSAEETGSPETPEEAPSPAGEPEEPATSD